MSGATWPFVLLAAICAISWLQVCLKMDPRAAGCGLFLALLALSIESANQWLGPFWIAQGSVYLIRIGLPVEKLILYAVGGAFACMLYSGLRAGRLHPELVHWSFIAAVAASMAAMEWVLNETQVFRWIRPWTVFAAFAYYLVGADLMLRFYAASFRAKIVVYAVLGSVTLLLALVPADPGSVLATGGFAGSLE